MSVNEEAASTPATSAATTKGHESFSIKYQQDREIGWSFEQSFPIPTGNRFVIESVNMTCRDPVKDAQITCTLSSGNAQLNFVFDSVENDFPYGTYRINQTTDIVMYGSVTIKIELVNPQPGIDMGIGDLSIDLSGRLWPE